MANSQTTTTSGRHDEGARQSQGGNSGPSGGQHSEGGGYADQASDIWDSAYQQGERYYRRGAQAVSNTDATTLGLMIAGAVGFGLAWLVLSQRYGTDYVARGMSESSDRHGRDHDQGRRRF